MRAASAVLLLLGGLGSHAAFAAVNEPWRPAPLYGADVRSLAIDPQDPDNAIAGTSAGQIYRSRDGGKTWSDAGASLPFPGWVVGSLSFDPNRPARLWGSFWGIWGGGLVAWSEDFGHSWAVPHPVRAEEQVYALALVPGERAVLYAGTRLGVYKSTDDGASWVKVSVSYPEMVNVSSLYVDALSPQTVISGTWHRAFRSDDGGATWRGIFTGMVDDSEIFSLHPVPWRAGELWASTCGWVYRTSDLGGKWTRYSEGFAERRTPSFAVLASGRLLAGTVAGLHASDDDGATWRRVTAPQLSVLALASHPSRPGRVLLGSEGAGVWRSEDAGATFVRSDQGMTNVRAAALLRTGDGLRVAVNHAGPASGIYLTRDGGRSFSGPAAVPTVLGLAAGDGAIWAATEQGLYRSRGEAYERVPELGAARVEQVLVDGRRVVARGAQKLWQSTGGAFTEVSYRHGPPRAAALDGGALLVADADGLYRLTEDANHAIAIPYAGGAVQAIDGLLVWSGKPGVFTRAGASSPWREAGGGWSRALETGAKACPVLLLSADSASLLSKSGASTPLPLAVPARDVVAAAVFDGRLWLGTSGHGLLSRPLDCPD